MAFFLVPLTSIMSIFEVSSIINPNFSKQFCVIIDFPDPVSTTASISSPNISIKVIAQSVFCGGLISSFFVSSSPAEDTLTLLTDFRAFGWSFWPY